MQNLWSKMQVGFYFEAHREKSGERAGVIKCFRRREARKKRKVKKYIFRPKVILRKQEE